MTGILIIAHASLANTLRDCVAHVYYGQSEGPGAINVLPDTESAAVLAQAHDKLTELIEVSGALILTGIFGVTPADIVSCLVDPDRVCVLAGVSLSMLVRAIRYRSKKLEQLATRVPTGGVQDVLQVGSIVVQNQVANHPGKYAAEGYHHHQ